jgi:hypothetical protein
MLRDKKRVLERYHSKNKEAGLNTTISENDGLTKVLGRLSTLSLIGRMVLALVAFPYSIKVNAESGWFGPSLAMADDGDGDGDGDGDSGGNDGDDADDDGDDSGHASDGSSGSNSTVIE